MITADDYELAEVALASSDSEAAALRMLRDECGWTLRHGLTVIRLIRGAASPVPPSPIMPVKDRP
jgi:hypothetical protein